MSRFLMVDIGAGTMDILYFDNESPQHYKAVVKSPVQTVAERAAGLLGNLVVTGSEMGGGPITEVLRERAGQAQVVMSVAAAATLSHRPERIRDCFDRIPKIRIISSEPKSVRRQKVANKFRCFLRRLWGPDSYVLSKYG